MKSSPYVIPRYPMLLGMSEIVQISIQERKKEMNNYIVDFLTKEGEYRHQVYQIAEIGDIRNDEKSITIIQHAKDMAEREYPKSIVYAITEVYGCLEMKELSRLAGSFELTTYPHQPIYINVPVMAETLGIPVKELKKRIDIYTCNESSRKEGKRK